MIRVHLQSAFLIGILLLGACSRTSSVPPGNGSEESEAVELAAAKPAPPRPLTPPRKTIPAAEVQTLAHHNAGFAFDLYARLKDRGQLFISPYSVSTALAMLYAGARGDTALEIAKVCRFNRPPEELPDAYANLIWNQLGERKSSSTSYTTKEGKKIPIKYAYEWRDANALWTRRGAPARGEYLDLLKRCFAAEAREADFAAPAAAAEMARWIAQQTLDKIKNLKIETTQDTQLVLVNAVYFKADWWTPFMPRSTYEEDFHLSDKERVKVPLMHGSQMRYQYMDQGVFHMIELPYRGDASMLVLLPKKIGLAELDPLLTADNFKGWLGKMHSQEAQVSLPKFELRQDLKLPEALKAMGMKHAFGPTADFRGIMSSEKLFVGEVLHGTYVKVDEQGTEAAATTVVEVGKSKPKVEPDRPIDFRVNRPFVFIIRDNLTGSVLFIGRVLDPRKVAA
ncbi:MAG: serpin family protein [Gemmataceae bacterium]|nr:serpin family protein [Gemmataceae bacterium]